MTAGTIDVAACVTRYARRLHAVIGTGHHVASPLGAWLLLALAGPASRGAERAALTDALGCDVALAGSLADELLSRPHPLVPAAAAVWTAPGAPVSQAFARWRDGLPGAVTSGELPDQAGLDDWASQHTLGLVDRFPIRWDPTLFLVLATALATRISWAVPFDLAPARSLGTDSAWAGRLGTVLRTPAARDPRGRRGQVQFVAASEPAGQVAVQVAVARQGLAVVSVAAAPGVPALAVLTAAHRIGCAFVLARDTGRLAVDRLPVGAGPAWEVTEQPQQPDDPDCTAVLPAWSATSEHDLSNPSLGFAAARQALAPGPGRWAAPQAATARYSRTGFEAAAVTATAVRLSAFRPVRRRVAELRFGHPYAVVAIATADPGAGEPASWHGLPVFSAWVADPQDASDQPAGAN